MEIIGQTSKESDVRHEKGVMIAVYFSTQFLISQLLPEADRKRVEISYVYTTFVSCIVRTMFYLCSIGRRRERKRKRKRESCFARFCSFCISSLSADRHSRDPDSLLYLRIQFPSLFPFVDDNKKLTATDKPLS